MDGDELNTESGITVPNGTGEGSVPSTPAATAPATDGGAGSTPGSAPGSTGEQSAPPAPQGDGTSQKMLSELINARRRAQEAEAEIVRLRRGGDLPPVNQPTPPPTFPSIGEPPRAPDPSAFGDDYDALHRAELQYAADLGRHNALKDMQGVLDTHVTTVLSAQRERERTTAAQASFRKQVDDASKIDPEVMMVATDPSIPWSDTMLRSMYSSNHAARLLKYFGANPQEVRQIASLDPISAALEMGRIETRLVIADQGTPTNRISQAPAPIVPVGQQGVGSIATDPEESATMEEFFTRRNATDPYTTGKA